MKLKSIFLAATLLVAAHTANALEFWQYIPGDGQLNNSSLEQHATVSVTGFSGEAGQFRGNFWAGGGAAPSDSFFRFFCAEVGPGVGPFGSIYNASVLVNNLLAKLYDVAYPTNGFGDYWSNGNPTTFGLFGGADADTKAAAFQVAVWEILSDAGLNLSGGSFQAGAGAIKTQAQAWLDLVAAYNPLSTGYTRWTLYYFTSPSPNCTAGAACSNWQDYVSATFRVPEPGTLALFGFALAGFGLLGRRRRA